MPRRRCTIAIYPGGSPHDVRGSWRGTMTPAFDLPDTRYIEGAPMEWRRWLPPGLSVVLHFEAEGLTVIGPHDERGRLPWEAVVDIDVRGPDEPEYPSGSHGGGPFRGVGLVGLASLLVWLIARARDRLPERVELSWVAFRLNASSEMIFEVYGALHDRLEAFLEAHSGDTIEQ